MSETIQARVLSVFEKACNLVNDQDNVLSLATTEIGMGPFTMSVSGIAFPKHVNETSSVEANQETLRIGDLNFHLGDAVLWNPRPHWEDLRAQIGKIRGGIAFIKEGLISNAPEGSLAGLLEGLSSGSDLQSMFVEVARKPAQDMVAGLREDNLDLLLSSAGALAGLGGGLTPAGDDWIVGCLLAIRIVQETDDAERMSSAIVDVVVPRTTTLSAAWLRTAAAGLCSERWHVLLGSLLEGEGILQATQDLAQLGHTSGADALAGFVASLEGFFTYPSSPV